MGSSDKEDRSAEASANDKAGEPVGVTETQSEKEHSQNVGKQDTRKSQRGRYQLHIDRTGDLMVKYTHDRL